MNYIVSGANGLIGQAVSSQLESLGHQVIRLSRSKDNRSTQLNLAQDLIEPFIESLKDSEINGFVHCAGVTPWSSSSPDWSEDIKMAQKVAAICSSLAIPKLVYTSGWNVYDMESSIPPFSEKAPTGPTTSYGESKLQVEAFFRESLPAQTVILRFASVYGPTQSSPGLITNLLKSGFESGILEISDSSCRRDYIYIDDAAVAVTRVLTNSNFTSGIVNIGSGKSYAVMDIADMLRSGFMANDIMVDIRTPCVEQPGSPIRDNRLDITLARSIGAIGELIRMEQGLQMCIESRKEHEHIS